MLRTTSSSIPIKISIITNFGCNHDCWYCIWKGHKLENINDPTDWGALYKFLTKNQDQGKFSVSGGGDCLYRYKNYEKWWDKIFSLSKKLNMLVDVHSRTKFINDTFWKKINKCVFSSDELYKDKEYLNYLSNVTKVRITHLVTEKTTFSMIDEYINFQKSINCQFTIKELIGYSDNGNYKKIKEKYNNIFSLDSGDYNIYYMPDNNIYSKFLI
jgi:hypothetical protein